MVGMLAALELFVGKDHAAEAREFERRAEEIRKAASSVAGVRAEIFVPEVANHVPHVRVSWDGASTGSRAACVRSSAGSRRVWIGVREDALNLKDTKEG